MVSLMQNEGETDNGKATFMVSFDHFSIRSESREPNVYFLAFSSIYYTDYTHSCCIHVSNHGLS